MTKTWIGENAFFDAFILIGSPAIVYSASFTTRKEAENFISQGGENESRHTRQADAEEGNHNQ
jgi:hypothetical protein